MATRVIVFVDPSASDIQAILAGSYSQVKQVTGGLAAFVSSKVEEPTARISARAQAKMLECDETGATPLMDSVAGEPSIPYVTKSPGKRGHKPDPTSKQSKVLLHLHDFPNTSRTDLVYKFGNSAVYANFTNGNLDNSDYPSFTNRGMETVSYLHSVLQSEANAA